MGARDLFKKLPRQDADLEELVAIGLPAEVVRRLAESTGSSVKPLQVARVARIAALAISAMGHRGLRWLREPKAALGDRVPLEMLGSDPGVRQVEQIIGRIEHGIFS
jgi:putative toxin-antitoxin system antitoxin component (TIGR02293 family)